MDTVKFKREKKCEIIQCHSWNGWRKQFY